jgi:hypothetical protein
MPRNEVFGWIWILAGLLSGTALGLRFHHEDWLGGYASARRRLIRLGHISFLGLGILNLLFTIGGPGLRLGPGALGLASFAFITGGVTMPLCCALMAWRRALHHVFVLPVASLLLGAGLAVWGLLRP